MKLESILLLKANTSGLCEHHFEAGSQFVISQIVQLNSKLYKYFKDFLDKSKGNKDKQKGPNYPTNCLSDHHSKPSPDLFITFLKPTIPNSLLYDPLTLFSFFYFAHALRGLWPLVVIK